MLRHIGDVSDLGKMPPQATDVEEVILGALLIESKTIHDVIKIIKPIYFYKDAHSLIFESILTIYRTSGHIDVLTVTDQLKKSGTLDQVGGPYYITQLTNKVSSSAHVESHTRIILEKWIKRKLIQISAELMNKAYLDSEDSFTLLDGGTSELLSVAQDVTKGNESSYPDLLEQSIQLTMHRMNSDEELIGLPTGLSDLDSITAGMQAPDLIIIAARPGMGKTALALQIASYVSQSVPVAAFSLEMSALQLTQRNQSNRAEIPLRGVQTGNLPDYEMERLIKITAEMKSDQLYIDDTPGLTLTELRAKLFTMAYKHGIKLAVIDYLQLMKYEGNSRDEGIGLISKGIKAIAKELNIPIILLSQLSRAVEQRGGTKRPQLSDLRESGSIEQDADAVWFIYRPEYYGITQDEEGNSLQGVGELIIAKHRNGALDSINLRFTGKYTKFKDFVHDTTEISNNQESHQEPLPF